MKAKYFKKLRATLKYYQVQRTYGLFGDFPMRWNDKWNYNYAPYIIVLVKNPENAVERAQRRGYGRGLSIDYHTKEQKWARFRVKELEKSEHWRNIYYF